MNAPSPRRFQYSIRALLIAVAIFAVGFAILRANRGWDALGGSLVLPFETQAVDEAATRSLTAWLKDRGFNLLDGTPKYAAFSIRGAPYHAKIDGSTRQYVQFYVATDHMLHVHLTTQSLLWPWESNRANLIAHE